MRLINWSSAGILITALALVVTVDQWIAATGSADPYQILLFDKSFSFMAAARGIAIVLSVAFAIRQLKGLRWSAVDRRLSHLLVAGVVAMLSIETFVIAPYTFSATSSTDLAKSLDTISPIVRIGWSIFVSVLSLLAVGLAAVSSLAEKPERQSRQPRKESNATNRTASTTTHQRVRRKRIRSK